MRAGGADPAKDALAAALGAMRFPGIAALQARLGVPVVVADFEMNGYNDAERTRFIEYAAMRFDGDGRAAIESSLIGSELGVFWPATKKTGLRASDLKGAPPWEDFAPRFQDIVNGSVLALYAAAFDVISLTEEQARLGHPIDGPRVLDVQVLARHALALPQAPSLTRACEALGVAFAGTAHRAAGDTLTTALLLEKLVAQGGVEAAAKLAAPMHKHHRVAPPPQVEEMLRSTGARVRPAEDIARELRVPPARVRTWRVELGLVAGSAKTGTRRPRGTRGPRASPQR